MSRFLALLFTVGFLLPLTLRAADPATDAEEAIVQLHKSGALYDKNQYKTVRAAFAKLFEAKHADTIKPAYGEDYDALTKWLDAHADLKQNFYTALDDRYDKIDKALSLFRDIWKKFPAELEKHPDLGIAVEGRTTWSRGGISIYFRDPDGHLVELATPGLWPGH